MQKKRRILSKILVLIVLFTFQNFLFGCMKSKSQDKKQDANKFDIKAASNVADTYMKYLARGDMENIKKFYSEKEFKNTLIEQDKDLKIFGFNFTEVNEVGNSASFKIRIARADVKKTFSSLDEYTTKIEKEQNDYKIKDTNNMVIKEAFLEGNDELRLRMKNNVNTNLIVNLNDIPSFSFSKDDKVNIDKTHVPKNKFGIINFSYSGENLAISTYDKDSFIANIRLDESMSVQGDSNEGADGGDGEQQKNDKDKAKEKTIGKEIISLDVIKNSQIEAMIFSPTEKYITVQYKNPSIGKCLRIYKTDGGDIIPFKFEEKYPMDKVDVIFLSYDKENLNFEVIPKITGDKSATDFLGKWQLNLRDFKQKKM